MKRNWPPSVANYLRIDRALPDWAVDHFGLSWSAEKAAIAIPIEGLTKFRSMRGYDPDLRTEPPTENKMFWADRTDRQQSEAWPPFPSWRDWRDLDTDVIVEGEFDAMAAIANGILATSGTMGATTFTQAWADALSGQSRTLLYDHDDAGRRGALSAAETLTRAGCLVRVASWPDDRPDGFDVTEHFRVGGTAAELRTIIAAAVRYEQAWAPVRLGRVLGGVEL